MEDIDYLPSRSILKKHNLIFDLPLSNRFRCSVFKHPTGAYFIDWGYNEFSLIDKNELPMFRLFVVSDKMLDICLTAANLDTSDTDDVTAQLVALESSVQND